MLSPCAELRTAVCMSLFVKIYASISLKSHQRVRFPLFVSSSWRLFTISAFVSSFACCFHSAKHTSENMNIKARMHICVDASEVGDLGVGSWELPSSESTRSHTFILPKLFTYNCCCQKPSLGQKQKIIFMGVGVCVCVCEFSTQYYFQISCNYLNI